jgi:ribonuclease BN (tRNA processing enzyme)
MRIQVLGCDGGIGDPLRTSALLLNDDVLLDAGTGVGELPLSQLLAIEHVFITHVHVDHIASLPLLIDAVMTRRARPITVYATDENLRALRAHIFNWSLWPDFTQLPSPESPSMCFSQLELGQTVDLGNCRITPIPANHTVPTVGFHLKNGSASVAYCGDTTTCDSLWAAVNAIESLEYLIIETAFDDSNLELAQRAGHLCPTLLAAELEKLRHPAGIYVSHMKPGLSETIMREITRLLGDHAPQELKRDQVFEL